MALLACCPGCANACMRVFTVSTGNIAMCSPMPAIAPATMCCGAAATTTGGSGGGKQRRLAARLT